MSRGDPAYRVGRSLYLIFGLFFKHIKPRSSFTLRMSARSVGRGFERSKSYMTAVEEDKGIRVKLDKSLSMSTPPILTVTPPTSRKLADVRVKNESKVFIQTQDKCGQGKRGSIESCLTVVSSSSRSGMRYYVLRYIIHTSMKYK